MSDKDLTNAAAKVTQEELENSQAKLIQELTEEVLSLREQLARERRYRKGYLIG
jgi:hypothetical protein